MSGFGNEERELESARTCRCSRRRPHRRARRRASPPEARPCWLGEGPRTGIDALGSVGGIDLTTFHGDRYDSSEHPWRPSLGWHDAAALVRGPVLADVDGHFRFRWREVTGDELPAAETPAESGDHELQLVQTIPEKVYRARPRGAFRILETYVRALRSAESLIYLESQFLWSPELVAILVDKLRRPPRDDFRIVAVLPSHPASGDDDSRGQVGV